MKRNPWSYLWSPHLTYRIIEQRTYNILITIMFFNPIVDIISYKNFPNKCSLITFIPGSYCVQLNCSHSTQRFGICKLFYLLKGSMRIIITKNAAENLYFSEFQPRSILATTSQWHEPLGLMSWPYFLNLTFTGTYQWVFRTFLKNRCSREHIYAGSISA